MTTFTAYIKKQHGRDDPFGDFSRDFIYILNNHPKYTECRGTDTLMSETLFGHYNFLPHSARQREYILDALCGLWKEWLEYKHIGLKFNRPQRGYVYFVRLAQKKNVFKIGRTKTEPEKRMASVALRERTELEIHDWIMINHYDIIEKELHAAFQPSCLMREWFEISPDHIQEAINVYSLTDPKAKVLSVSLEQEELDGKFVTAKQ